MTWVSTAASTAHLIVYELYESTNSGRLRGNKKNLDIS